MVPLCLLRILRPGYKKSRPAVRDGLITHVTTKIPADECDDIFVHKFVFDLFGCMVFSDLSFVFGLGPDRYMTISVHSTSVHVFRQIRNLDHFGT